MTTLIIRTGYDFRTVELIGEDEEYYYLKGKDGKQTRRLKNECFKTEKEAREYYEDYSAPINL